MRFLKVIALALLVGALSGSDAFAADSHSSGRGGRGARSGGPGAERGEGRRGRGRHASRSHRGRGSHREDAPQARRGRRGGSRGGAYRGPGPKRGGPKASEGTGRDGRRGRPQLNRDGSGGSRGDPARCAVEEMVKQYVDTMDRLESWTEGGLMRSKTYSTPRWAMSSIALLTVAIALPVATLSALVLGGWLSAGAARHTLQDDGDSRDDDDPTNRQRVPRSRTAGGGHRPHHDQGFAKARPQNPANWRQFNRRLALRARRLRNRGLHGGACRRVRTRL